MSNVVVPLGGTLSTILGLYFSIHHAFKIQYQDQKFLLDQKKKELMSGQLAKIISDYENIFINNDSVYNETYNFVDDQTGMEREYSREVYSIEIPRFSLIKVQEHFKTILIYGTDDLIKSYRTLASILKDLSIHAKNTDIYLLISSAYYPDSEAEMNLNSGRPVFVNLKVVH